MMQPKFNENKEYEQETAKNWDYLGSIHAVYMMLIESITNYTRALSTNVTGHGAKADLKSKVHAAAMMAYCHLEEHLKGNTKISFEDYQNIWKEDVDEKELLNLCYCLIDWYQRHGYFKLVNESYAYKDVFAQADEENK